MSTDFAVLQQGNTRLRRRLAAAEFTAEHWRAHAVTWPDPLRAAAHPLCMVLSALGGETDPVQLGIDPDAHDDLAESLRTTNKEDE